MCLGWLGLALTFQREYNKAHCNAYGERMTEGQEKQLERRLTKLCLND